MNILIIGSGGREHALAWKAAQSAKATHVFVAPGNAGTALESKISNVPIEVHQINELCQFAKSNNVSLTIVGPEVPLAAGIVDIFSEQGLKCFGPTKAAAQLESSKAFSKAFMQKYHIPTAKYATFSDLTDAKNYVEQQGTPIVIKEDGLAAGKGVVIANTIKEAFTALELIFANSNTVVIEEFLVGEEASFIVMVDGKNYLPLATSQDHKARDNGDKGPNTGGMGAYSPAPIVTNKLHTRILKEIIEPTIAGMLSQGHAYTGFLYAGLMITPQAELKVLEYNCRLGDPEAQVILLRLKSDIVELCEAALSGSISQFPIEWDSKVALGVVLAAGGYPSNYEKGVEIHGLDNSEVTEAKVFHAGTKSLDGKIVTAGGRVLCVTALGDKVSTAAQLAYQAAKVIHWDKSFYRTDIGYKAIAREKST